MAIEFMTYQNPFKKGLSLFSLLLFSGCFSFSGSSCKKKIKKELGSFHWLIGTWEHKSENFISVETWKMIPGRHGDSILVGNSLQIEGKDTLFKEDLCIENRSDSFFYVAQPDGSKATRFFIQKTSEKSFLAVNYQHDFPSEISYSSEKSSVLSAVVSGKVKENERKICFSWTRKN